MPPRILIVDDDDASCSLTAEIVREAGYDADTAGGGANALELIEQHQYDLIVLDYKMPDMDGLELFARIKQARPETAGLFLTAYATIDMIQAALGAGARRVIPKEADSKELLSVVEKIVGKSE